MKRDHGFTIVELLIVIVVIGILAAITIVAYSGITNRADATKAQTNGANVLKVAESYNADLGRYPTVAELTGYNGVAKIPTGITVAATVLTSSIGKTNIQYIPKGTTGGCIGWWDFAATTPIAKAIYAGDATASNFVTPSCT